MAQVYKSPKAVITGQNITNSQGIYMITKNLLRGNTLTASIKNSLHEGHVRHSCAHFPPTSIHHTDMLHAPGPSQIYGIQHP
eukprot:8495971-Ditylum_brightwellii.AAC.1